MNFVLLFEILSALILLIIVLLFLKLLIMSWASIDVAGSRNILYVDEGPKNSSYLLELEEAPVSEAIFIVIDWFYSTIQS